MAKATYMQRECGHEWMLMQQHACIGAADIAAESLRLMRNFLFEK